ncbi:MAG TPA: class I SAM-dependent methyltransferase [Candidatus Binatia bacterium]|nr:class I SAM-dependent methyltransferase [Candidatus Binatia bacterium]
MNLLPPDDSGDRFALGGAPFWPVDHLAEPSAWVGHIPFAFWVVDALRPRRLVELGTHSGNSYFAFAQAVQRLGLDTACFAVDTWQGDAHARHYGEDVFEAVSRYHDGRYGAFSRLVRSTFEDAVQHFPDGSIDLLHVDGCHTYEAVAHDVEGWRPKLSTRAVVLLHDINVREGDFGAWRLWAELCGRYPHFEFLHAHGLGVLGVGSEQPPALVALWQAARDATRVGRIRDAFARLGSSVVERMQLEAHVRAVESQVEGLSVAMRTAHEAVARGAEGRASLEEALWVRDREITQHVRQIHWLQQEIVRLGQRVEHERADRVAEVAALQAELSAVYGSRSWRLVRPLRQGVSWYRAARGRSRPAP